MDGNLAHYPGYIIISEEDERLLHHNDIDSARKEAERLANKHQGCSFVIFKPFKRYRLPISSIDNVCVYDAKKKFDAYEYVMKNVKEKESVNHPLHYGGDTTYEAIKVIRAWGHDKCHCVGDALKYLCRMGKKDIADSVEDLQKAIWYLNKQLEYELQDKEKENGAKKE